jgi:CspA family cold shock protein
MDGIVKWFNDAKGFGFIQSGQKDYFVHYRQIISKGFKTLSEGQAVRFTPCTRLKGPVAEDVRTDLGDDNREGNT